MASQLTDDQLRTLINRLVGVAVWTSEGIRMTLLNFWVKEGRTQFKTIPKREEAGGLAVVPEIPADTFNNIIKKTKEELLKYVSCDRS